MIVKGKFLILILTLFAYQATTVCKSNTICTNDSLVITGKLIEIENNKEIIVGTIELNGKNYSVGETGDFLIKINKTPDIKILFKSIGYRPLMIVNIRPDSDSINLGTIPMFIETQTLINYTCEWWQFICKYRRNRHSGGLDKYSRNERVKSNKTVDKYRFEFRKENYPIIHSRRNDLLTIEL